jgi:hypothetical protein
MVGEMFALLAGSIFLFAAFNPAGGAVACAVAVLLAAGLWWGCSIYVHLWNTAFLLSPAHHVLCAIAALWTIFVVVAFVSIADEGERIHRVVIDWAQETTSTLTRTQLTPVQVRGTEASLFTNFKDGHAFLGSVLDSRGVALLTTQETAMNSSDVLRLVATSISSSLAEHVEYLSLRLRLALLLSFLLGQAIPFGFMGYVAYRDIRPSN